MVGAIVSNAFSPAGGVGRVSVPCCWDHVSWVCPGFADTRAITPRNVFQPVLGWPSCHAALDAAVLAHLSKRDCGWCIVESMST